MLNDLAVAQDLLPNARKAMADWGARQRLPR